MGHIVVILDIMILIVIAVLLILIPLFVLLPPQGARRYENVARRIGHVGSEKEGRG